jgi:hypothetical protein
MSTSLEEKYNKFVFNYWKGVYEMKITSNAVLDNYIADLFIRLGAPLTKKEWLNRELQEATSIEDYEYCLQLKNELLNV